MDAQYTFASIIAVLGVVLIVLAGVITHKIGGKTARGLALLAALAGMAVTGAGLDLLISLNTFQLIGGN